MKKQVKKKKEKQEEEEEEAEEDGVVRFGTHLNLDGDNGGSDNVEQRVKRFGKFKFPNSVCVYLSSSASKSSSKKSCQIVKHILCDVQKHLDKCRGMIFTSDEKSDSYSEVIPSLFMYEQYEKQVMNNLCKMQQTQNSKSSYPAFCIVESDVEMIKYDEIQDVTDIECVEHFFEMSHACEDTMFVLVRENHKNELIWLNRSKEFGYIVLEIANDTKYLAEMLLENRKKSIKNLDKYKYLIFTPKSFYQWRMIVPNKTVKIGKHSLWQFAAAVAAAVQQTSK